jgi:hypothetical protein
MSFRIDWRGLSKILEDQKKLNEDVLKRLKAAESRLAKLEKPTKKEDKVEE